MADVHELLREGLGQIGVDGGRGESEGLGVLIGVGVRTRVMPAIRIAAMHMGQGWPLA